jgi:hypothetical protein
MEKDFCFPSPLNRSKCPLLLTFWHSFHFIFYNAPLSGIFRNSSADNKQERAIIREAWGRGTRVTIILYALPYKTL